MQVSARLYAMLPKLTVIPLSMCKTWHNCEDTGACMYSPIRCWCLQMHAGILASRSVPCLQGSVLFWQVYERAIANIPPAPEKRYWQRYIYLWINYALFEELEAQDTDRTREVYRACLKLIPHKAFTFAKVLFGVLISQHFCTLYLHAPGEYWCWKQTVSVNKGGFASGGRIASSEGCERRGKGVGGVGGQKGSMNGPVSSK